MPSSRRGPAPEQRAMPTVPPTELTYPTSDGRPVAETDDHRELMVALIKALQAYYANDPMVYVSGNLLLFYEQGNRRSHVSPDVFVVKGVAKHRRDNYLMWEEGKGPDFVIELTSSSTRDEDIEDKFACTATGCKYRNTSCSTHTRIT
jgi:Uma2 family endonuclease